MAIPKFLRSTRQAYLSVLDEFRRAFPEKLQALPSYGLSESQIYPEGVNFLEAISLGLEKQLFGLRIDAEAKVGSIGTCFAEEISRHLYAKGGRGNYLRLEDNLFDSSANWGRVYTIKNLRQIIEYSFNPEYEVVCAKSNKGYFDPLRDYAAGHFVTEMGLIQNINTHRQASRNVFEATDLMVITLGQNETWRDERGFVWGAIPPKELRRSVEVESIALGFDENLRDLNYVLTELRHHNPAIQILLTVSPVPAFATFLSQEVVSQSFAGKCLLRSVVHQVLQSHAANVFYFPSFEIALCDNPSTFKSDNRHVKAKRVEEIFRTLDRTVLGRTT